MTIDNRLCIEPRPIDRGQSFRWSATLGGGAIALLWLSFNWPALRWIAAATREVSVIQALLLAVGGLLLIGQAIRQRSRLQLSFVPIFHRAPLILMLGCGISSLLAQWLISLEQIPVLLFVLGTYGWLGLHLTPIAWRRGLAVAVAIACIFPFGVQFSTGLGFPTRILTAHAVELIFNHLHIAALSSEDIIVLDTGLARVDLPCSGLKSLWTGTLFLLAATWLEGRQLGGRWLLVCLANVGLLVVANIARVFTLVFILQVLQQPAIAQTLHVPLGIVSFIAVCTIAWMLLRWVPRHTSKSAPSQSAAPAPASTRYAVGVALCLLVLMGMPRPDAIAFQPIDLARLQLPAAIQTESIALNPFEQSFFANYENASVQKQHFQFQGLSGDLLLVASTSWQAHHSPELCLISSGLSVSQMEQQQLAPAVLGRWLSIDGGQSAAYWFQSPRRTTDDYLSRIWGEVSRQDSVWVLASVLFDAPQTADRPAVQSFVESVHDSIAQGLRS